MLKHEYVFDVDGASDALVAMGVPEKLSHDPFRRDWFHFYTYLKELASTVKDPNELPASGGNRQRLLDKLDLIEDGKVLDFNGRTGTVVIDFDHGCDETIELPKVLGMIEPAELREKLAPPVAYDLWNMSAFILGNISRYPRPEVHLKQHVDLDTGVKTITATLEIPILERPDDKKA